MRARQRVYASNKCHLHPTSVKIPFRPFSLCSPIPAHRIPLPLSLARTASCARQSVFSPDLSVPQPTYPARRMHWLHVLSLYALDIRAQHEEFLVYQTGQSFFWARESRRRLLRMRAPSSRCSLASLSCSKRHLKTRKTHHTSNKHRAMARLQRLPPCPSCLGKGGGERESEGARVQQRAYRDVRAGERDCRHVQIHRNMIPSAGFSSLDRSQLNGLNGYLKDARLR